MLRPDHYITTTEHCHRTNHRPSSQSGARALRSDRVRRRQETMMHRADGLDLGLGLGLGLASQGSLTSSTTTAASSSPASASHSQHWTAALSSVIGLRKEEPGVQASTSPESGGTKRGLERTGSGLAAGSDEDDDGGDGAGGRKKLRLSKDQAAVLEECFKTHSTLNPKQKRALANRLGLRPRQVEVWFQNRRARTKLKQTEVDCEYMKRCCEQLAEQNRRLEKEVAELRALMAAPPPHSAAAAAGPLTTLTMCLSCKRVASTSSASACDVPNFSTNAGIGMPMPSPVALPDHRQFFCGYRDTGATYGGSSGLTKVVKPAR
uniref:Homeobox domain-containing protein n=2 Tax=Hordeum vulgare subsp. vulgare TaxID=112509 RepID=A0A8I6YRF3_HORVV